MTTQIQAITTLSLTWTTHQSACFYPDPPSILRTEAGVLSNHIMLLTCIPSQLRIKSKLNLMVYEALCDLAPARLYPLMSHRSPVPRSNRFTLALLHLVRVYPHWLFCVSCTGPPSADMQVVPHIISGGAFSRLLGEWCSLKRVTRQPSSHKLRSSPLPGLGTCWSLCLVHPSAGSAHAWLLLVIHSTNISQSITLYPAELIT